MASIISTSTVVVVLKYEEKTCRLVFKINESVNLLKVKVHKLTSRSSRNKIFWLNECIIFVELKGMTPKYKKDMQIR